MKKWTGFVCALVLSVFCATAVMAAEPVEAVGHGLLVNGDWVEFPADEPAVIADNRTLVPLAFLPEVLGGTSEWDEATGEVTLTRGETLVRLRVGSLLAEVNGEERTMDTAPVQYQGTVYIPLRFMAEAFDMTVVWHADSGTAMAADNAMLEKIAALLENKPEGESSPPMSADLIVDVLITELQFDSDTAEEPIRTSMEGTIEQDINNSFQHIVMKTSSDYTEEIVIETYNDATAQYMIFGDEVMKTESVFSVTSDIMAQYDLLADLDLDLEYYAGFKLEEEDGFYVISGQLFLPESYMNEMFARMTGAGDMAALMSMLSISIPDPIGYMTVIDPETGYMVSLSMSYTVEMALPLSEDEEVVARMFYVMQMPRIEMNAQFETVVPEWIVEKALSVEDLEDVEVE